jgi:SH3-like domain-containing protein
MPDGRPTPTRQPVPRWLTLKASEVRARSGPGLDYHILWEYHAAGPAGSGDRRDPGMAQDLRSRRRRRLGPPQRGPLAPQRLQRHRAEIPIHSGRSDTAPVRARLSPRSIVSLDDVRGRLVPGRRRKVHGWVPQRTVFGGATQPLCDAAAPGTGRGPSVNRTVEPALRLV